MFSSIAGFLILIFILATIHEFGHFIVARLCGVHVEIFSVGFGPAIIKFKDRRGTEWRISAIPLGGYVKMYGDADITSVASDEGCKGDTDPRSSTSFHTKSLLQRTLVVLAGPVANYLLAIIVFAWIFIYYGFSTVPPVINDIVQGEPAAIAGLHKNDRILRIGDTQINSVDDIYLKLSEIPGVRTSIEIERSGKKIEYDVSLKERAIDPGAAEIKTGYLGVSFDLSKAEIIKMGIFDALRQGTIKTYDYTLLMLRGLRMLFSGDKIQDAIGGPIQIAKFAGSSLDRGMVHFLGFLAIFSINLGFMNLLPIPTLDGGTLLFYIYEMVARKPLSPRIQNALIKIGIFILIFLMIFAFTNDIRKVLFNKLSN